MARARRRIHATNEKTFTSKKLTYLDYMCRDKRLSSSDFRVGFAITQHVNSRLGYAFPSGELLAKECKRSISTIKNAVGRLVALGYFRVSRPHRSSTNRYHPNLDIELIEAIGDVDEDDS